MLVAFNSINIGYSAGLEFTYNESTIGSVLSGICLSLPIIAVVLLFVLDQSDFGEFVDLFRNENCIKKHYMVAAIILRVILGLLMSQLN